MGIGIAYVGMVVLALSFLTIGWCCGILAQRHVITEKRA